MRPHDFAVDYRPRRRSQVCATAAAMACVLLNTSGCRIGARVELIELESLENGSRLEPHALGLALVSDVAALEEAFQPLGPRLGLVRVRSSVGWERLREIAPTLADQPDFRHGLAVGVISRCGEPLDGVWPIEVDEARLFQGAVYLTVDFHSGTYLADGAAYLDMVYIPDGTDVLVVEVNGVRFYPGIE